MGLGTVEVGDGCLPDTGTSREEVCWRNMPLFSPPLPSPPLPSHASGQLRGVRLRVAQQRRADVHLAGREGAVGGPGLALATPRLDDRSGNGIQSARPGARG